MNIIPIKNEKNENTDICKPCGGHCCKWSPGRFTPDQVTSNSGKVKQELQALLDAGKHVFVKIDKIWMMQPRTNLTSGFDQDGLGRCVNLTDSGCSLEHDSRPLECQKLVPSADGKCFYPKEFDINTAIVDLWRPYQTTIEKLYDDYWDKIPVRKS